MTAISVTPPFAIFSDVEGESLEAGQFYIGTANQNPLIAANQLAVYSDAALTIPVAQPVRTSGGYAVNNSGTPVQTYVGAADYSIVVLDRNGALVFSSLSNKTKLGLIDLSTDVTGLLPGTFLNYPITTAEAAAGVAIVNSWVPSHDVCGILWGHRFGTNTTPGTTDMSPAMQACINVALQIIGGSSGKAGPAIRFTNGFFSFSTILTFGGALVNVLPLDIGGVGLGTQFCCNYPAGTSYLFNMNGKCGYYLHDFIMCGNTANKNGGIQVGGGAASIEFRIERVLSLMAGIGIKMSDTNTGYVNSYMHWPGNNPDLIVPQAVNAADISHGVYMTGGFCHNIGFRDCWLNGHSGYGGGAMRGLKVDVTFSFGVTLDGSFLAQTLSGLNNDISLEITPTNSACGWIIENLYNEGATLYIKNMTNSVISGVVNGEVGGAIRVDGVSRFNVFQGIRTAVIDITDATGFSQGNTFIGCSVGVGPIAWVNTTTYYVGNYITQGGQVYRCILQNLNQVPPNATYWVPINAFNDANEGNNLSTQPNRIMGSFLAQDVGYMWRKLLAYSANMTGDVLGPNHNVVRVSSGAAMTVNTPAHPRNGAQVIHTMRNESGGVMGVITWNGLPTAGWVNPANGFNRSVCHYYDSDFAQWKQLWVTTVDCAN